MTFQYQWHDLLRVIPGALRPARLAIGTVIGLACTYGWAALQWASQLDASGITKWLVAAIVIAIWWLVFCCGKLALMRGTTIWLARRDLNATRNGLIFGVFYGRSLSLMPLSLLVTGLPFLLLGAAIGGLLWLAGLLGWQWAESNALIGLLAPFGIYTALWVLTLPLSFASMAAMGGDSWESIGRGFNLGLRRAPIYAALSLPEHAAVAAILWIGWETGASAGPLLAGLMLAPVFAAWTAVDVAVYLIVRHRLDAAPVWEVVIPSERLSGRVSHQELVAAQKS